MTTKDKTGDNLRQYEIRALDSATKYPSIPTYHRIRGKGLLQEDPLSFAGKVHLSEKIHGTNARIILDPTGDYVIGTRDQLIHARGDYIVNPVMGLVEELRDLAERLTPPVAGVQVHYLEVYGGRVTDGSRWYAGNRTTTGHRLFDVATVPPEVLARPVKWISSWREGGGQTYFARGDELEEWAEREQVALVPDLGWVDATDLPTDVEGMASYLTQILPSTQAALDSEATGTTEGIILRSADRAMIAKARHEDYTRTLKRRAKTSKELTRHDQGGK